MALKVNTNLQILGEVESNLFKTPSGAPTQFLKADGSIDSNDYALFSELQDGLATKEDTFFKNTAFNKDFGITAGTVAEGDHTHAIYELKANKEQPNGYAPLDGGAKIPESFLPDSIVGQVEYQGTWNASTDSPILPSATTVKGHYYIVETAGTYQTIDYAVGDWIISNGTAWAKVDNSDAVATVFGRIGNILANESDYASFYPRFSQSYTNPGWIASLPWSKITNTPTTLSGYGITDAFTKTESDGRYVRFDIGTQGLTATQKSYARTNISAEPAFSKNSAFNKNFGGTGSATTVSRTDHTHLESDISDLGDYLLRNGSLPMTGTLDGQRIIASTLNNTIPSSLHTQIDGYGILGNRSTFYITNGYSNGNIMFGLGGIHSSNDKLEIKSTYTKSYQPFHSESFININSSDSSILLGGGGTKAVSDFPVSKEGGNITSSATLDSTKRNGMYRIDNGVSSTPTSSYFSLLVYGNENNVVNQLASDYQTGQTYIRAFNNIWSSWRRVWDANNLRSNSENDTRYVEVAGDTMSGNLIKEDYSGKIVLGQNGHILQRNANSTQYWATSTRNSGSWDLSTQTTDPYTDGSNGTLSNANAVLSVNPNGNVGIGTDTPSEKLEVNGNISADKVYSISATSSLRKLKKNILPFKDSGLDLINSLEIQKFDYKEEKKGTGQIGIMADDAPKEFLTEEKDAVNLYKTIFVQAKAIQELSKKNQELEKRLEKIEKLLSNA